MSLKQAEESFIITHGSPPLQDPLYFLNLRKKDIKLKQLKRVSNAQRDG